MSQQVIITSQRKHTRCLGTDKIQIGLRSRKRKDGAQPRSLGSSLGPLSTRQRRRHTPRSSHRGVLLKRSLQNEQPLLGSVLSYWQARRTRYQKCNRTTRDTELWVQRITGFAAEKRQRLQLTTETLYNIRLKERDKRAYRNQLLLLTKQQPIQDLPLSQEANRITHTVD